MADTTDQPADATAAPPPGGAGLVLVIGPPRCGTTAMLDAIRCHPHARFERSSVLFGRLTRGSHDRYPRELCVQSGGVRVEQRPKELVRVPTFNLADEDRQGGWMVERLHPHFFLQEPDWLLARVEQLEGAGAPVRLVLRVREPRAMLRSHWGYKRRSPGWQEWLGDERLVEFARGSYESVESIAKRRPDCVVSVFEDRLSAVEARRVYDALWPGGDWGPLASEVEVEAAVERRGARAMQTFTRAGENGQDTDGEAQFKAILRKGSKHLKACERAYEAIVGAG
ncbi:MAG: hypothetical protein ACF8Q5_10575 [Phycisphaerales bacterium JB040]